ncbi:hypothetical protein ACK3SF_00675 [Candidatus Nanosalina sp. VS9-1]|uniref:hypothetical protein n=1 Tax=Candidatus Nanosalina sp. VS9-1 TaxID=3388566 RepID=UPI0039DF99F4
MDESLELEWSYFRELLDAQDKETIISEAATAKEAGVRYAKHPIEPELFREFLFERDPDDSDEEWQMQRAARMLMEEYGQVMDAVGQKDISLKLRRRELDGVQGELVQVVNGAMKDTYRGLETDTLVQIPSPKLFGSPQAAVEQALIWKNTNKTLQHNDIPVATDYDVMISQHRGRLTPALIGPFNEDLVEYGDVTDEHREMFNERHGEDALEGLFRKRGVQLANLFFEGEVSYDERPEDIVNPPHTGLGYDTGREDVVVYDMGEASREAFGTQHMDIDSYEEFVERHGIRERADKILEGLDKEYV